MGHDSYVSFALDKITPDLELPASVFLFINGKFLEYKKKGDVISSIKFNYFILKKINYIFVESSDHNLFMEWIAKSDKKLFSIVSFGDDCKKIFQLKSHIRKFAYDMFTSEYEDNKVLGIVQSTRSFIQETSSKVVPEVAWRKLSVASNNIVDHSLNVALLSVYLASHLGFAQHKILENIFLGALFHDYGKTLFDQKLYETENKKVLDGLIKKHPSMAIEVLKDGRSFNGEILRIIEEHHEWYDGKGYPNKKRKSQIYDLTKIVSIANVFDNLIQNTNGDATEKTVKVISMLEDKEGTEFEPEKLEKCIKAIKLTL